MGSTGFYLYGAPPHYHRNVRSYLNEFLPSKWIGKQGSPEYPPHSANLDPLDFLLCGPLKDNVYDTKPETIIEMKVPTEQECSQISVKMLIAAWDSISSRCQRCLDHYGEQFANMR